MANVTITELPAVTSVTGSTAVVPVVEAGTTDKITVNDLVKSGLPTQTGNASKALTTNGTTAAWGVVGLAGGGTGATTAATARTALGVQQMSSSAVPTLFASINTAQAIANGVQTSLVFDTFTTQTITGLTWNATKKGFVNTTANTMNLIVAAQSMWAASATSGIRAEYIRVYSSADVLLSQYGQDLDYGTTGGAVDFNSSCSPVIIPAGGYLVIAVVQTSETTLNNGGISSAGTPGTTINAMQLFAPV